MYKRLLNALTIVTVLGSLLVVPLSASEPIEANVSAQASAPQLASPVRWDEGEDDAAPQPVRMSHRLIVELESPPLAQWSKETNLARAAGDRLDINSPNAKDYVTQLDAEQTAAINAMQTALPGASVGVYINESKQAVQQTYQVVFNGFVVDPGAHDKETARVALTKLPGVKAVYYDYARQPDLYASLPLVNAAAAWNDPAIGGKANAGAGVKFASMDGGAHHSAPMFDGTGYTYPSGFPLGDPLNNNGKIIVSKAYFRSWDGPAAGDENTWPGENGTSHGVHTASTVAGNEVVADYLGITETLSGVAPKAYVMSYRVFYASLAGDGSFYDAEGIAALEDIAVDGADVLNNSWGGGPGSVGGEFDALDTALINVANAGTFISMSAGNSGPNQGTTDHPSDEYIGVAATTTDGTYASGRLSVSAPEPISSTLQNMAYSQASFGGVITAGMVFTYPFAVGAVISPANSFGCNPWPAGTFTGQAALISRGTCEFGVKVLNAEQAGAEFVIVHNNAGGGDALINMGAGAVGHLVTIPSIFIWYSKGVGMTNWYTTYGAASELEVDTFAFQAGNTPDVVVNFSSRGPGQGNVLKPDIAAPGYNILAQGFTPNTTGEDRHLGYGQASGTSMAAPHVAGAAALLRQIHPAWSNAYIKSALMSTAKYMDIYNYDDSPAQPLDMGAGRLDLTNAADPGVILDPPSLSFGLVPTGTTQSITVTVTSVATTTETYALDTLYTGAGFLPTQTTALPGFSVVPASLVLGPGASDSFVVTFDPAAGMGMNDNQGYILLDGATYDAHMPAWARVTYAAPLADVLIIDSDFSSLLGYADYTWYYTTTLESLGYTYDYWDADQYYGNPITIPDLATLMGYKAILLFTGDHYQADGTFTVATPFTEGDMYRLNEYANNGGAIIAMGQDLASVLNSAATGDPANDNREFFYGFTLGGNWLQDDVSGGVGVVSPTYVISNTDELPLANITLDLGPMGDGAANQAYVDEIQAGFWVTPSGYTTGTHGPTDINYAPVLQYPDPSNIQSGAVAVTHRAQPTLESSGVAYNGRSLYTTFGLEGVNNDTSYSTREELIQRALDWAWDEPQVTISAVISGCNTELTANLTSNIPGVTIVSSRWDYGDGGPYAGPYAGNTSNHAYAHGSYTARVEVIDSLGNRAIGATQVSQPDACVTLLHTNDFHGNLEFPGGTSSTPGIARTAYVINGVRTEVGADNVALLDAGDIMQGTLLSNLFKGESTIDVYDNCVGYDVATFGNHEFDWGQTVLLSRTQQASFPFLSANIVSYTGDCATAGWTKPSFVDAPWMTMTVGAPGNEIVVGLVGVTTQETPYITIASATEGLCFKDPAESISHYYTDMINAGAEVIVVLSHLGYTDGGYGYGFDVYGDQTLATMLQDAGTPAHLIIGGHSHTNMLALTPPLPGGNWVNNTLVVQAFYAGRQVGRADIAIHNGEPVITWQPLVVSPSGPQDAAVQACVNTWASDPWYQQQINKFVGYTNVDLVRNYNGDGTMGAFVNDSIYYDLNNDDEPLNDVDMVFNNPGGLRADINTGGTTPYTLTHGLLYSVLPFGNATIVGDMTGAQIQDLLNQSATLFKGALQVGGVRYTFYRYSDALPGLQPWAWGAYSITVRSRTTGLYEPLVMTRTYRIATNEFLAPAGQDGFTPFKYVTNYTYWGDMLDGVERWVSTAYSTTASAYNEPLDGRITRNGNDADGDVIPVTILHHNDSHGNLAKGTYVGYTQLAALIKKERAHNPDRTILLNAGDQIQGDGMMYYYRTAFTGFASDGATLPVTMTTHPMMAVMNAMTYTAWTLGNHEYNFGHYIFTGTIGQANFPTMQANVYDDGQYGLDEIPVLPHITVTLPVSGSEDIKLAVLGIGNHRIPNYELPSNIPGLHFTNPITEAAARVPALEAENDAVVALTHIGFTENLGSVEVDENVDTNLAAQVAGIDAIIGGHSHTDPSKQTAASGEYKYLPAIVGSPDNTPVIINQAYRYNSMLGEVVLGLLPKSGGGYEVVARAGRDVLVKLDDPEDLVIKAIVDPYVDFFAAYNNQILGQTTVPIDALLAYTQETNAANLQADAAMFELGQNGITPDFHLSGAMSNRKVANTATVTSPYTLTIANMFTLMPYENSLVTMEINGAQLKAILERGYRNYYYYKYVPGYGGYSYYTTCMLDTNANNQITYRDTYPALPNGNNVESMVVGGVPITFTNAYTYHVSTVNYLAAGSCNFNDGGVSLWPLDQIVNDTQLYVRDAVIDYVKDQGVISPAIEGRLVFNLFPYSIYLPIVAKNH